MGSNGGLTMDDRTLRQHVLEELDFDPKVDAAGIGVSVRDGIVTLSGHVGTYAEKIAAEKITQRVRGVRAVVQEVEVRYPANEKTGDEELAARVVKVLTWNVQVPGRGDQGQGREWLRHPRWLRALVLPEGRGAVRRLEARGRPGGAEPPCCQAAGPVGGRQSKGARSSEADGTGS